MNTTDPVKLAELVAPLREEPRSSAIFCDVDGTLAPIVTEPADAHVPDSTRAALREVGRRFRLVACITGRPALEARLMVGVEEITYAGNHGLELLEPHSTAVELDPDVAESAHAAADFVGKLPALELAELGLRIEDKGPIQALHWRGAADEEAAEARALEIALEAAQAELVPKPGRKVIELRPTAAVNKGTAAGRLLDRAGAEQALFGGDDLTDLDAFRALRARRDEGGLGLAICIGVASEEAPARLWDESDALVGGTEGFAWVLRLLAGSGHADEASG